MVYTYYYFIINMQSLLIYITIALVLLFEVEEEIENAIYDFLLQVIESATENNRGPKGCFLASSVMTTIEQVEGVGERLERATSESEARLAARFDREIEKVNLPPDVSSRQRALMLFDLRQGYMFCGRASWDSANMQRNIDTRVRMLLSQ